MLFAATAASARLVARQLLVAGTALAALGHRAEAATARGAAARARSLHEEQPEHTEQRACANEEQHGALRPPHPIQGARGQERCTDGEQRGAEL